MNPTPTLTFIKGDTLRIVILCLLVLIQGFQGILGASPDTLTSPEDPLGITPPPKNLNISEDQELGLTPGIVKTRVGETDISIAFSPSAEYTSALTFLINQARKEIKICMYNMDSTHVLDLLKQAQSRGVKIEIILHKDGRKENAIREEYMTLLREFATVHELNTKKLDVKTKSSIIPANISLHHKFILIDGETVWMGSGNASNRAILYNDETALMMKSAEIAKVYSDEFNRLLTLPPEDVDKKPLVFKVKLKDSDYIDILMLPAQQSAVKYIIDLIESAEKEIVILMSDFTNDELAKKLIEKHKKGIKVSILTNKDKASLYPSDIRRFVNKGLTVVYSQNDHTMHQRCMVVDSKKAMVSTANFSERGLNANIENIVVIENEVIAKAIKEEFNRCSYAIPYTNSKWRNKKLVK